MSNSERNSRWNNLEEITKFEEGRQETDAAFLKVMRGIAENHFPLRGQILDIGAGEGALRRRVPTSFQTRLVHSDIAKPYLAELKSQAPDAKAAVADAAKLPFADNSFSGAVSLSALHVIDNLEEVIHEVDRVLKPGGIFINVIDLVPTISPLYDYLADRGYMLLPAADTAGQRRIKQTAFQ